jgi:hypothetical protein
MSIDKQFYDILWKPKEQVIRILTNEGYTVNILREDGTKFSMPSDDRINHWRVNLIIENGLVVRANAF